MRGLAVMMVLSSAAAWAEPLPARNAGDVRVAVANKVRHAFALKAVADGGWRLELGADAERADLIDVTPGTPARTLSVPVIARVVKLDGVRFVGGHVYHLALRSGARTASGFVYLHPVAAAKQAPRGKVERVKFSDGDNKPSDDAIGTVDKGSL